MEKSAQEPETKRCVQCDTFWGSAVTAFFCSGCYKKALEANDPRVQVSQSDSSLIQNLVVSEPSATQSTDNTNEEKKDEAPKAEAKEEKKEATEKSADAKDKKEA